MGRDECGTHARVEADFLVDRSGISLEGAGLSTFGSVSTHTATIILMLRTPPAVGRRSQKQRQRAADTDCGRPSVLCRTHSSTKDTPCPSV
jgi:hypothetical protein